MSAVVTGLGAASPNGLGLNEYWAATLRGESGIRRLARFDVDRYPATLAGEIRDFDPEAYLPGRLVPQTDRMTQLALAATQWALADAVVDPDRVAGMRAGVTTAGAFGGFEFGQRELEHLWRDGANHVSAYMSFAWFYAVNSGQISIRHDLRGPTGVFVSEQAGGLDAVAQARRNLRKGLRLVVTGGLESSLCPYGWAAHLAGRRVSLRDRPDRAFLPFDPDATGYVPGEGGAILVLESAAAARERGARVYGEIAGYGATFDPGLTTGRPPGLRRAAEIAIADAGLRVADIGAVFADGAGLPDLDRLEAQAIAGLFGAYAVPVTVPKTMTGRLFAGGAPLDLVAALLALRDGVLPPTVNVASPASDYEIDLVTGAPRPWSGRAALVLARGTGGFNAAMVVRAAE